MNAGAEPRVRHFTGYGGIPLVADVWEEGGAPPLLLLHAGCQTRRAWQVAGGRLAALGHHVVAPDLRGHGASGRPTGSGGYGLDLFANDVRALVSALDGLPVVVGASLGGLSALLAAGEEPRAAVRALVLVDVAHRPDPRGLRRIVETMRRLPHGETWDPRLLESFEHRMDPPGMTERLLGAACRSDVPVLVARGQLSDVVSEEAAADFCARVPRARSVEVAGAGHTMAGERNAAFVDAVLPFLREHAR
ncbi:alpha/beta fold hydrolase [Streptomyces sp. NPDC087440]|uniref:alpha/beta fold hydrolase n=1 Tax=Streptomyces sp. NPDC087440 TaxID=3365790 RepID=UPI00380AC981